MDKKPFVIPTLLDDDNWNIDPDDPPETTDTPTGTMPGPET